MYDCTTPRESGVKPRKRRCPYNKRRGCRAGSKVRKRRAVVGSVPVIRKPAPSKLDGLAAANCRAVSNMRRADYMDSRRKKWLLTRARKAVELSRGLENLRRRMAEKEISEEFFQRLRKAYHAQKSLYHTIEQKWIKSSAAASGDSIEFTTLRFSLVLMDLGLDYEEVSPGMTPRQIEAQRRRTAARRSRQAVMRTNVGFFEFVISDEPLQFNTIHHCNDLCDSDCDQGQTLPVYRGSGPSRPRGRGSRTRGSNRARGRGNRRGAPRGNRRRSPPRLS